MELKISMSVGGLDSSLSDLLVAYPMQQEIGRNVSLDFVFPQISSLITKYERPL
jgi:hypothetical protein